MDLVQTHLPSRLFDTSYVICWTQSWPAALALAEHLSLCKVLTLISSGRTTPVDTEEAIMQMNLKSLRLNVPSPIDTVHLWPP